MNRFLNGLGAGACVAIALFLLAQTIAYLSPRAVCTSTYTTTQSKVRFVDGWPRVAVEPLLICETYTVDQ